MLLYIMPIFQIITNVFIPTLSGIILFVYFLYFVIIEETKSQSTKFFKMFLLSFSIYLIGRPIQVLSGPYPNPLILTNIRTYIFFVITIPAIILSDFSQPSKKTRLKLWPLVLHGLLMATVYSIFHILATSSSEVIFTFGPLIGYDNLTPDMKPPFYGREVTNSLNAYIAGLLLIDSIRKLNKAKNFKVVLYNSGKLIYAITLLTGSLMQQWWIYYVGSLISVFFLGYGINQDIKENRVRMSNVISYIKENLIQEISIDVEIHKQVKDMLTILDIPSDINTFIAMKNSNLNCANFQLKDLSNYLEKILGRNQFILLPLGTNMVGICLLIPPKADFGKEITITICESIKSKVNFMSNYNFGIGRSYSSYEELKNSYKEAIHALEYANSIEGGQVLHILDLQEEIVREKYPLKERNVFLTAIRLGDRDKVQKILEDEPDFLRWYSGDGKLLKIRIYELIGNIIESAMTGGGDVDELLELSEKLYSESNLIRSYSQLLRWITSRAEEVVSIVVRSHSDRSNNIVRRAKEYIDEHFFEAITVKDVADAVCISESYLKSLFKKNSNETYTEILTTARINQAKKLLKSTDKSITEIAMDVGYQTPNAFSSIFKKVTGLRPTQYKNNLKVGN